jgi:hypothetical protein
MTKCLKPDFCKLKKEQCIRSSAACWAQRVDTQVDWPNSFWDMTKCLKPYSANWRNNSVVDAAEHAQHNPLTLMKIGPIAFEIWQNAWNTYSCKLSDFQCSRRSITYWALCVDTQVDWPNSFWDLTKCIKPCSCKLEKQQCSRRSATCWAQRVDTQVDWPNSFWDMTKCLKPYSANWRNNSVVDAAEHAQHNALTLTTIGPIAFEIWQNVWNTYSCKLSDFQCSRRSKTYWALCVDTQVDWPNSFWDMTQCLKPYSCKLKKQQCSRRSATCGAQRVDTQVDWPNSIWDMTKSLKPYSCKLKK